MTDESELAAQRSLFFTTGQDLYFLSYNLLVLLYSVGATTEKPIKDARTLPLLITLVADAQLLDLMARRGMDIPRSSGDYRLLVNAESKAQRKRPYVARLLGALERRGFLEAEIAGDRRSVGLRDRAALSEFISAPVFDQERSNAKKLREVVPRAKILTRETLYERVFEARGVRVWRD